LIQVIQICHFDRGKYTIWRLARYSWRSKWKKLCWWKKGNRATRFAFFVN